jgi:YHS domain-containing protein
MLRRVARIVVVVAVAGLAAACGGRSGEPSQPPTPPPAEAGNGLVIVEDTSQVCMINNQYMGRTQILVEVEGRTYWGCCPACKDRLTNDPESRLAKDPVTGEVVDKAHAVIAKDARNAVLYFASALNVRKYQGAL